MAKTKIPGLKNSEGKKGLGLVADGQYEFKVISVKEKPSEKSAGTNYAFAMSILSGPEQKDGRMPDGRPYFENLFIMDEEHTSYEEYGSIGVDAMKSACEACGVAISNSDLLDIDQFADAVFLGTVRTRKPKKEGDQPRNEISIWEVLAD